MPDAPLTYEVREGVATIRLNRPHVHNALAPESVRALALVWRQFALDRTARVAVLVGAGKSFCAGRDMKATDLGLGPRDLGAQDDGLSSLPGERRRLSYTVPAHLYKPVIAAVQGAALGGGLELALGCDIRIADTSARLGLPEVTRGVIPGSGGLYWLPRVAGLGVALELALSGRIVDAREALELRLVNRVVEPAALLPAAYELARRIAANAPLAVQAAKETLLRGAGAGLDEGLYLSEHQNRVLQMTQDAREGTEAFEQKREPRYQGR